MQQVFKMNQDESVMNTGCVQRLSSPPERIIFFSPRSFSLKNRKRNGQEKLVCRFILRSTSWP